MEVSEEILPNAPDHLITLNVGGFLHTTTLYTLLNFPDSLLGAMFSGRHVSAMKDKDGNLFIDRNGKIFELILDFMRSRQLCLPDGFDSLELLKSEADFFQIPELVILVNERIKEKTNKEEELRLKELEKKVTQHFELVDIERLDSERVRQQHQEANEDEDAEDEEEDIEGEEDQLIDGVSPIDQRGLLLKGSGMVMDSLSPSDSIRALIQQELYRNLPARNPDLLSSYTTVNLERDLLTKMTIIEYFRRKNWQLISATVNDFPEKMCTIHRYIWGLPPSECKSHLPSDEPQ